jgi:hypothetical protein
MPPDPVLSFALSYDPAADVAAPYISTGKRPRVAVLREQGVNSQVEMGAAFDRAGFEGRGRPHVGHPRRTGDACVVQGPRRVRRLFIRRRPRRRAGVGEIDSLQRKARAEFERFFGRSDTFALGSCNGCQMMAALKEIIPAQAHWPVFVRNRSEQFEGRFVLVEVPQSPSSCFAGMAGSRMPIVTCARRRHGASSDAPDQAGGARLHALRRPSGCDYRDLSAEPERLAGRHHRAHYARWPVHDRNAAPGTRVPLGADVLDAGRCAGRFAVDANLPQCARLGWLTRAVRPVPWLGRRREPSASAG